MDVPLAVLADYANVTREGKLNIMGIFGRVFAPVLPFVLPQMQLVMVLQYGPAERGGDKTLEIRLLMADGEQLLGLTSVFQIPADAPLAGEINQTLALNGATFPRYGDYAFHILINGEPKRELHFRVDPPST